MVAKFKIHDNFVLKGTRDGFPLIVRSIELYPPEPVYHLKHFFSKVEIEIGESALIEKYHKVN